MGHRDVVGVHPQVIPPPLTDYIINYVYATTTDFSSFHLSSFFDSSLIFHLFIFRFFTVLSCGGASTEANGPQLDWGACACGSFKC